MGILYADGVGGFNSSADAGVDLSIRPSNNGFDFLVGELVIDTDICANALADRQQLSLESGDDNGVSWG